MEESKMLTAKKLAKIHMEARDHATEAWNDSADPTPITGGTQPDESLINALGTDALCQRYGLKSWETDGEEFCKQYNKVYVRTWNDLCE